MGNLPLRQLLNCITVESFEEILLIFSDKDDGIIIKDNFQYDQIRDLDDYIAYDLYKNDGLVVIESKRK